MCAFLGALVMALKADDRAGRGESADDAGEVFDRPHLVRYTLDNAELEREIIGLFIGQLPSIVAMLEEANSPEAWKMAAHTLKGSAAAVGATDIHGSAVHLEELGYIFNVDVKIKLIEDLRGKCERFHAVIRSIYP